MAAMDFQGNNWKTLKSPGRTYDSTVKGLCCRVTADGRHEWVLRYSPIKYHQVYEVLGACEKMTITQARDRALRLKLGTAAPAPRKPKSKTLPPIVKWKTVLEAGEQFLVEYPHASKAEQRNKGTNMKRIVARFGKQTMDCFTEESITEFLDDIIREGHKATRNAVHRTLSCFLGWAKSRIPGTPKANPCREIRYLKGPSRDVRLYKEELPLLGKAVMASTHLYRWGTIIPLLCGGRIGALEHIEEGRWEPEKQRVEFSETQEGVKKLKYLYVSPECRWCWAQLPRISPALIRESWEEIRASAEFGKHIVRHDFRRSWRDRAQGENIEHSVAELLMGHTLGVASIYLEGDWETMSHANNKVSAAIWKLMGFKPLTKSRAKLTPKVTIEGPIT